MAALQKLTLYSWVGSQWAGVVHLGLAEKGLDKNEIEIKEIDLFKAENFHPEYLKINPNGTVPSLKAPSLNEPLVDTREILEFLDRYRPSTRGPDLIPVNAQDKAAAQALIELVHSHDLETGLILSGCLDNADIDQMKSSPLFNYLAARQSALEKYVAADPANAFYATRFKDNGALHKHFTDASKTADREAFFSETAAGYRKFADGLETLERQIRLPYAVGDHVTVADLHIVPWLSHTLWALGTTDPTDFSKLEQRVRRTVPDFQIGPKTRRWWTNFGERDSFREVFKVLH
ncbi:MAG: hypothetical protein Q9208_006025 [Pyrenodesmia sp. 3 TL-2023]